MRPGKASGLKRGAQLVSEGVDHEVRVDYVQCTWLFHGGTPPGWARHMLGGWGGVQGLSRGVV